MKKKTKLFLFIIFLEMLIVFLYAFWIYKTRDKHFISIPVNVSEFSTDIGTLNADGSYQIYNEDNDGISYDEAIGSVDIENSAQFLKSNDIKINKGNYTLHIDYVASANQGVQLTADHNESGNVVSNPFILERSLNSEDYQFEIKGDTEFFKIIFLYNQKGFFRVNSIYLTSNDNLYKRNLLYILLICLIIDIIFLLKITSNEQRIVLLSTFGIAVLVSLPLFYSGVHIGDDLKYHLLRIEAIVHEIRLGYFPCRLSTLWLGGYGYPSSIYYGDILLYFPAMLRLLGLSVSSSYKTFVFAINFLTTISAIICFKKIFDNSKISVLCSLCYVFAPYRLTDVYARSAVGEYCAFIFYPIIVMIMIRMISGENKGLKNNICNACLFSFGMSGLVLTHILSTEMTIFALLLTVLLYIKKIFTKDNLHTILFAIINSLILCLFFIVPFLDYYINVPVKINYMVSNKSHNIQSSGIDFSQLFEFFDNSFAGNSTGYSYNAGLILMLALMISIYLWIQKKVSKKIKVLAVLSLLYLWLSTKLFPWDFLAKIQPFDMMANVQFAWRYLGLSIIFLTLLLGYLLKENIEPRFNNKRTFICASSLVVLFAFFYTSVYDDYAGRNIVYDTHEVNSSYLIGAEYLRSGTGRSAYIFTNIQSLTGGLYGIGTKEIDEIERNGNSYVFHCITGSSKSSATVPLLNYKGYHAYDESGNELTIKDGSEYTINISLPQNYDGKIYVNFITPWYWNAALAVSIIFCIVIIICFFCVKKAKA